MRCFVALDLEPAPSADLEAWLEKAREACPELAVTPPHNLHLTLAFLGELDEAGAAEARATVVVEAASGEPWEIGWGPAGVFPSPSRARVFWLGVEEGGDRLVDLRAALAAALRRRGLEVEARAFRPHLTLARLRGRAVDRERLRELVEFMAVAPQPRPSRACGLTLFRSRLGRPAAVHEPLLTAQLA